MDRWRGREGRCSSARVPERNSLQELEAAQRFTLISVRPSGAAQLRFAADETLAFARDLAAETWYVGQTNRNVHPLECFSGT